MDFQYFDAHSHVTFKDYDLDLEAVLERMRDDRVGTITVGVDRATSEGRYYLLRSTKAFGPR